MIILDKCIPHNENPLLIVDEYNRYMEQAKEWVCFLDSDAMFLHPRWNYIMLRAIESLGKEAGLITCMTNRIGHKTQLSIDCPQDDDIVKHTKYSIAIEEKNRGVYYNCENEMPMSGHFMLTHKEAWKKANGFRTHNNGFLGVDNNYFRDIKKAGYKIFLMKDMYVYHRYHRYWKKKPAPWNIDNE